MYVLTCLPPDCTTVRPQGGQPFNAQVMPDNSLLITQADSYNSGQYTCRATSAAGTQTATATLDVTSKDQSSLALSSSWLSKVLSSVL